MSWKTLDDMDFTGKTALVRVDINVPISHGVVSDDTRIRAVLPTLRDISAAGGKVVLLAHFGQPQGQTRAGDVPETSAAGAVRSPWETRGLCQ